MNGISFVFVAHGGELQIKAAVLAASLFRNVARDSELIAAVPEPERDWGALDPAAARLFDAIGVRCVPIRNEINRNYPIGNKLTALGVRCENDRVVFLDSDMMLIKPFFDHPLLSRTCAAKPADIDTFKASGGQWSRVYRLFGQPVPRARMKASVTGELMMPYYNAGLLYSRDNERLSRTWVEVCRVIDRSAKIGRKRPWLDQIGLPVAAAMTGTEVVELGDEFNFPAHKQALEDGNLPYFCHYHWPSVIAESPILKNQLAEHSASFPELTELMRLDANWRELAQELDN